MPSNYRSLRKLFFPTAHRLLLDKLLKSYYNYLVGCLLVVGTGKSTYSSLYQSAKSVIYTDINPLSPDVVFADVHDLPFPDNSFDSILSIEVFEHLHNPNIAASELLRVLRPSGTALVSIPFLFHIHGDPFDYQRFSHSGLLQLFQSFSEVHIVPFGSRIHVISDILLTANKFFSLLRIINYPLVAFSFLLLSSSDCPSGYVVLLKK